MILKDIQELWAVDAKIDKYNLTEESLKIPMLHSKYYEIYMTEKNLLNRETEKFKNFLLAKTYWYSGKLGKEELQNLGLKQFVPTLLKGDIPIVVDADDEIIDKRLKIAEQNDKVEFVKSILQNINQRTYVIKNALENTRFEAGG